MSSARRRYLDAIEARARCEALTGVIVAIIGLAGVTALAETVIEPAIVGWLAEAVADLARWTAGIRVVLALVAPVVWASVVPGSPATMLALLRIARAIGGAREISGALDRIPG